MKLAKTSLLAALVGIIAFSNVFLLINTVHAADARNYNAGRIIDDSVFTNTSSMSVQDIQNFFNSKVTCDTWGQKKLSNGMTRAQWMNARGIYAPFRCMTDFKENPATGENNYGKNETPAGAISAAQIIYNYSQQFTINPQVIIATLQKENGIITDDIPQPKQFNEAMGFGCPDNVAPGAPACNPAYGGFSAQIYQAARHFRGFMNNSPGWFVPFTSGNNFIRFSPTSSCGGSTVYIENRATVALYSYTPYQPNQAAKNAQYGHGDGCSAYGNRNFYLFFTDWFGSTYSTVSITTPLRVYSNVDEGYYSGMSTTVSFDMYNSRSTAIDLGGMAVSVRDSLGRNYDFPLKSIVIPGHSYARYEAAQVLPLEGTYTFRIANYSNGSWKEDYPASNNTSNPRVVSIPFLMAPTVTSSLNVANELRIGKATPVSFAVKNNSAQQLNLGKMGVGVRGPHNENFDFSLDNITLNAGETYTYTKNFVPTIEGTHNFSIIATVNNGRSWESGYPVTAAPISRNASQAVRAGVTVTQSLLSNSTDLRVGQQTPLTFKVKNYGSSSVNIGSIGLSGRDPSNRNVDPGIVPVTLAAGEERTMTFNFLPTQVGRYRFSILATPDSGRTWTTGPPSETVVITKGLDINVGHGVTVSGNLQSSGEMRTGQPTTLSFKVKNYGSSSVNIGSIGLSGRDPDNVNIDPGVIPTTLNAAEERTINFTFTPMKAGKYRFGIINTPDNGYTWNGGPPSDSAVIIRAIEPQSLPGVTVSASLQLQTPTLKVGVVNQLTFKLKNHTSSSTNIGIVGLMGRDPSGANVDPGAASITLVANEERTITYNVLPTKTGEYVFAIIGLKNGSSTWLTDYPPSETQAITRSIRVQAIP